jgi:DNA polymerase-3 subunit delta'
MTFYGNKKTVSMLNRFIDRQELPQSVLITGPSGVGKTTLALHLSMYLLCKDRTDGAACGRCISCLRIQSNEHPEVAIIEPDGDLTKIWQLWTRSGHAPGALDSLSNRPDLGNWRVVIITAAHTFNDESANSILKVLEEPPSYVQFFLCTTSQSAVLPTIASRCFSVPVPPLPTQLIATMLQTDHNVEPSLAEELAKSSAGCPGRAIRAKDDTEVSLIRDRAAAWVSDFLQGSRNQIYAYAESLRGIVPKSSPDASTRQTVTKGIQAVADAFGKQLSSSTDSVDALMDCVALSMQAAHAVQRNGNQQIVTEALVAKLSKRCHRR